VLSAPLTKPENPRLGFSGEAAAARCRPPPSAVVLRRPAACGRLEPSDPDPTHPAARFTRKPLQPLDLDPMDLDLVNLSQASQTPAGSVTFAENPHVFWYSQIYPSAETKPLRFSPFL
jgi:hypothetical protein